MADAYVGRFAPSPSGSFHLGNVAASLLAWLDVRVGGGCLVMRMEDLDPLRCRPEYALRISEELTHLGLNWDSGWFSPEDTLYAQSHRTKLYEDAFEQLNRKGLVYPCYCTRNERLAASAPHEGESSKHSGCKCRYLSADQRRSLEAMGRRPSWKVAVPDIEINFTDGHYGKISERLTDSGDFIVKRSDGVFAYQLAVSFDDMDMGISRVVRGRDLISSTARQIWLIRTLGGNGPEYCHCPLVVSSDSKKLSKRDGALGMQSLLKSHSPEEIIGLLSGLLRLSDGKPVSAAELISGFSWDKVPSDDIIL